jgi:bidirectional [NiFe] hydrogenase diaphorase subunit
VVSTLAPATRRGATVGADDHDVQADEKKWKMIDARIRRRGRAPDSLIEVLHSVQEAFGYLEPEVLAYVGDALGVPLSRVYGVATFYSLFTLKPQGAHTVVVCTGTACYINQASALLARLHDLLKIAPGETSADRAVSLLSARCVGACSMAPAVVVDGDVRGHLTPAGMDELVAGLRP